MGTAETQLEGYRTLMAAALEIKSLHAWYGESHVLHGVDLHVGKGEVVTLLGRNGAGRTTTMRSILGLTGARKGSIQVDGKETIGLRTYRIAHLGIGYCPEERGIFASLSCEENLMLPPPRCRRREPRAVRHERRRDLCDVSESEGAREISRISTVGWRAANARSGAHTPYRRASIAAGRDFRGPGAGDRQQAGER